MTDQSQDPKPQAAPFPEAGGIAFTTLYGTNKEGAVIEINLTSRKPSATEALDDLWASIGNAKEKYGLRPFDPRRPKLVMTATEQPPTVPAQAGVPMQPPPATTPVPATQPAPAHAPTPAQEGQSEDAGFFICNRIVLTPTAGKPKLTVGFYDPNPRLDWAVITGFYTPEEIFSAMSAAHAGRLTWTLEQFKSGAVVDYPGLAPFRVNWKKGKPTGKTNKQGQPNFYKDIQGIVPV